jgi:hypothetical protein
MSDVANYRRTRVLVDPKSTIRVALLASFADHLQAHNSQIAGLIVAWYPLRLPLFRFSRLQFVGYEAADSHLMAEVPVKHNGAGA